VPERPDLSIVIPTRDRAEKLRRCLLALRAQEAPPAAEILVVDDGSRDDTPGVLERFPEATAIRRDAAGRGAARNPGVERARGDVVLFLDDDVVAAPDLLRRHADHHRAHPDLSAALQGRVTWAPELTITPHMRWLEHGGPLFAFDTITDPDDVGWRHFCTANVSLKRELLPPGGAFDEQLERCEDVELAWRLHQAGMRLRYDPGALAHHLRTDTPATTEARMEAVGRAMRKVHVCHPELAEPPPPFRRSSAAKAVLARTLAPLARPLVGERLDLRIWSYRAARGYARGYGEPAGAALQSNGAAPRPEPAT